MKTFLLLIMVLLISCTQAQNGSYAFNGDDLLTGKLMQHNTEVTTVLRVIKVDAANGRFDGVVVQNINGVLCDTVTAYKSEYHLCPTCIDECI